MTAIMVRALKLLTLAGLAISVAWFRRNPDFEPALAVIGSLVALLAADWWQENGLVARLLGFPLRRLFSPVARAFERRRPVAKLAFKTLRGDEVTEHVVEIFRVWERAGFSTTWLELRHRSSTLRRYTFDLVDGHAPTIFAEDFNGDGAAEVAVEYGCGAHTHVLSVYALDPAGVLRPVPGGQIGSDWPEISWSDKDGDGKPEIYVKHRNWSRASTDEPASVLECHVWTAEGYKERPMVAGGAHDD